MRTAELAALVRDRAAGTDRFIAAIAGPPGSGKSTLATALVAELGAGARAIPLDGFHYDDRVLDARGLRSRKGAPETFDVAGFLHLLSRLRNGEDQVAIPLFDRSTETAHAGADIVTTDDRILIVEGNYLLLDENPWSQMASYFDLTIFLDVAIEDLECRLLDRWATFGKTPEEARAWIDGNDMPNIRRVVSSSRRGDIVMATQGPD